MARETHKDRERNDETRGPGSNFGSGGWHRRGEDGHPHHHHHGLPADERQGRSMRGPGEDGGRRGGRRSPWGDARGFGPGRQGSRDTGRGGPGGEGREAVIALITAARQVARTGDDTQRQAAKAVLDEAARAIWSILAEGPTTTPDAPVVVVDDSSADAVGGNADAATDA